MLAVLGNVVTTWSWFGVNELSIGLHSYGGSDSSVKMALAAVALSQILIFVFALLLLPSYKKGQVAG